MWSIGKFTYTCIFSKSASYWPRIILIHNNSFRTVSKIVNGYISTNYWTFTFLSIQFLNFLIMSQDHPREYPIAIDNSGHVIQVQLAERCVRASRTVMGLKSENGVLLLCEIENAESLNQITQVKENIIAAGSGFAGDIMFLLNKCELLSDTYRLKFQQNVPLDELVQQLSDFISLNTLMKTVRPYRASLIIAGWDTSGYHLYLINPSGEISSWAAVAIGRNALPCQEAYGREKHRISTMSLKVAKKMGVDIFHSTVIQDLSRLQMVWLKSVDKRIEVVMASKEDIDAIAQGNV